MDLINAKVILIKDLNGRYTPLYRRGKDSPCFYFDQEYTRQGGNLWDYEITNLLTVTVLEEFPTPTFDSLTKNAIAIKFREVGGSCNRIAVRFREGYSWSISGELSSTYAGDMERLVDLNTLEILEEVNE